MKKNKDTILITGSSGRIGYPLAKRLAESFNVVGGRFITGSRFENSR